MLPWVHTLFDLGQQHHQWITTANSVYPCVTVYLYKKSVKKLFLSPLPKKTFVAIGLVIPHDFVYWWVCLVVWFHQDTMKLGRLCSCTASLLHEVFSSMYPKVLLWTVTGFLSHMILSTVGVVLWFCHQDPMELSRLMCSALPALHCMRFCLHVPLNHWLLELLCGFATKAQRSSMCLWVLLPLALRCMRFCLHVPQSRFLLWFNHWIVFPRECNHPRELSCGFATRTLSSVGLKFLLLPALVSHEVLPPCALLSLDSFCWFDGLLRWVLDSPRISPHKVILGETHKG